MESWTVVLLALAAPKIAPSASRTTMDWSSQFKSVIASSVMILPPTRAPRRTGRGRRPGRGLLTMGRRPFVKIRAGP